MFRIDVSDLKELPNNGDENFKSKTSTSFPFGSGKLKNGLLANERVDKTESPKLTAGSKSFGLNRIP